jgi:hypothetical protein
MKPNLNMIKPVFLPLMVVCLGIFSDQMNANAELTNTNAIQSKISPSGMPPVVGSGIDTQTEPRSTWRSEKRPAQAIPNPAIHRKASLLGKPLTLTNRSATTSEALFSSAFRLAQSTTVPAYLSADIPVGTVSETVPSSTATPPTVVTPNNNLPNTTGSEVTAPTSQTAPNATTPIQPLAQTAVSPGRSTQSGSSYVGIGGNIGIGNGDTALGRGSFSVISKIGLTRNFSARPSVLFGDSTTILIPVTYDFNFGEGPTSNLGFSAAPYLGAGVAISTGNNSNVGLLLTGGIDVPLSSQFTATAAINASVTGNAAVGLLVGVGYNFR